MKYRWKNGAHSKADSGFCSLSIIHSVDMATIYTIKQQQTNQKF